MARALFAGLVILAASAAMAADVTGEWIRDDGMAKLRFSACGGDAVCGFIAGKKDAKGPAKIGEQVFFDMKPSGVDAWAGSAYNPDDGKRYCFSSGTSLEMFLDMPHAYLERAQAEWRNMSARPK